MKNKKIIITLIILIIVLGIILLIKINTKKNINTSSNITKNNIVKNTIFDVSEEPKTVYIVKKEARAFGIDGILKNNTNQTIKNIELATTFYDKEGNKLRKNSTRMEELLPGQTWKFTIATYESKYKYDNIQITYDN
ncbi:MAG: FxLYD domain-containing protein [Clostridia bacterium]